jgi:hypothetical protein
MFPSVSFPEHINPEAGFDGQVLRRQGTLSLIVARSVEQRGHADQIGTGGRVGLEAEADEPFSRMRQPWQLRSSAAMRPNIRVNEFSQRPEMVLSGAHPHQHTVVGERAHHVRIERREHCGRRVERGVDER